MAAYLVIVKYAQWFLEDEPQEGNVVEADFFSMGVVDRHG
jgi:hypothetical protein